MVGGRMSTSAIVTDVDLVMRRASKIPGPGAYDNTYGSQKSGGRFSTAKPKTEVEWLMHRARQLPGPGQYNLPLSAPSGGKFGAGQPKSDLEQIIARSAKLPGPGNYDSDIYSIGRRTGAVSSISQSLSPSRTVTPQHSSSIPPEARRMTKPKRTDEVTDNPRPHTSLGLVRDRKKSPGTPGARLPHLDPVGDKKPWYKRGMSREGSRARTLATWLIPESAQRAYGVWNDDAIRQRKPKSRRKTAADADKSKSLVIEVHLDSGNPTISGDGKYEYQVFDADPPLLVSKIGYVCLPPK